MDKKAAAKSVVRLVLGGCGFLMLAAPAWWAGFVCALVSLILSVRTGKSGVKAERVTSLIAILLAVGGAAAYAATSLVDGNRRWL